MTAEDFARLFEEKGIHPVAGRFNLCKSTDGTWQLGEMGSCGCAVAAYLAGRPLSASSMLQQFFDETGIHPWSFVNGFDQVKDEGFSGNLSAEAARSSKNAYDLGARVRELVLK